MARTLWILLALGATGTAGWLFHRRAQTQAPVALAAVPAKAPEGPAATPAPPRTAEEVERLRQEVAALRGQVASLKGQDEVKSTVYQAMLDQAQRNLMASPLDLSWDEFYRLSENLQADEPTLIRNILERLGREAGLTFEERQGIDLHLQRERGEIETAFRERYGDTIEASMFDLTEEQVTRIGHEILEMRKQVRKRNQEDFERLVPDPVKRAAVEKHLRNDIRLTFDGSGQVFGGVGIPIDTPEAAPK